MNNLPVARSLLSSRRSVSERGATVAAEQGEVRGKWRGIGPGALFSIAPRLLTERRNEHLKNVCHIHSFSTLDDELLRQY